MIDIVLEVYWSNNPIPVNNLFDNPDIVFDLPLGFFTGLDAQVTSVNGKTGSVILKADDVEAEPAGSVSQAVSVLLPQINDLSERKLDAVDYVQHFRGLHNSYADLITALPIGNDGDYAHIKESQNFGRLEAIWSGTAGIWNITSANIGINTDAVPEGNTNLYFKSERALTALLNGFNPINAAVTATDTIIQGISKAQGQISNIISNFAANVRATLLTGFNTSDSTPITDKDNFIQAFGKSQSQLNLVKANWVNARDIGTFHQNIAVSNLYFAKINGMLFVKGSITAAFPVAADSLFFEVTDKNYNVLAPSSGALNPNTFLQFFSYSYTDTFVTTRLRTSGKCTTATEALNVTQTWRTVNTQISTGELLIPPTCVGMTLR